jgi:hypothetical protein
MKIKYNTSVHAKHGLFNAPQTLARASTITANLDQQ